MTPRQAGILIAFALISLSGRCAENAERKISIPKPTYDTIDRYAEREIEGWRVLVNQRLLDKDHGALCDRTLKLLDDHLYRISRVVPAEALAKLHQIPIWVELAHPRHPCMCYHESADWLR